MAPPKPHFFEKKKKKNNPRSFLQRNRKNKDTTSSVLDEIEGVGFIRKRWLLERFGGLHEVKRASIDELASVKGISKSLAEKIYSQIHE